MVFLVGPFFLLWSCRTRREDLAEPVPRAVCEPSPGRVPLIYSDVDTGGGAARKVVAEPHGAGVVELCGLRCWLVELGVWMERCPPPRVEVGQVFLTSSSFSFFIDKTPGGKRL